MSAKIYIQKFYGCQRLSVRVVFGHILQSFFCVSCFCRFFNFTLPATSLPLFVSPSQTLLAICHSSSYWNARRTTRAAFFRFLTLCLSQHISSNMNISFLSSCGTPRLQFQKSTCVDYGIPSSTLLISCTVLYPYNIKLSSIDLHIFVFVVFLISFSRRTEFRVFINSLHLPILFTIPDSYYSSTPCRHPYLQIYIQILLDWYSFRQYHSTFLRLTFK